MKYLLILAAFLLLAACEKDGSTDTSGEAMSNAISNAMDETKPQVVDEVMDEVMDAAKDAGDATMADMAETMGSTIDDAKGAVAELEKAMTESDAEMEMEKAKKLIGE